MKPQDDVTFTIVLPMRNGWPFIREAVESVLNQSFSGFELVILDNHSSDGSLEWCRELDDDRVMIYESPVPLSIEASWQRIVSLEKREFLVLFAHDDILEEGFLEEIRRLIKIHPDANLYHANAKLIDTDGRDIRPCSSVSSKVFLSDYLRDRFSGSIDVFGSGYVVRASDYDRVGGIPMFSGLSFADDALWVSLIGTGYKACSQSRLVGIRIHDSSESATKPENWRGFLTAIKEFYYFLKADEHAKRAMKDPELSGLEREFYRRYLINIYILLLIDLSSSDVTTRNEEKQNFVGTYRLLTSREFRNGIHISKLLPILLVDFIARRALPLLWAAYGRFRRL